MKSKNKSQQRLWGNKDFITYWIGITISNLGNSLTLFVFPLMILDITDSAFQIALVSALQLLPYAVLGLPAGAIIDKLDNKKIMKVADITRFILYLSIPISSYFGYLTIYQIYIVSLISGTAFVFHSISEVTSIPNLVKKESLSSANSLIYASQNFTSFLGPIIGGFLYSKIGYSYLITIDSLTFLVSFITLTLIKKDFNINRVGDSPKNSFKLKSIKLDIILGLKYLLSDHKIKVMAFVITSTNLIVAPYYVYTLIFAQNTLNASPELLGMLFGISSLGALVGSLVTPKLSGKFVFYRLIVVVILIDTVARIILPFSPTIYLMIPILTLTYATQAIVNILIITLRQSTVPANMLGKVNSVFKTMAFASQPLGLLIGGIIIDSLGGFLALLIVGILCIPILAYTIINMLYKNPEKNLTSYGVKKSAE